MVYFYAKSNIISMPLLHLFSFPGVLKLVVYFAKIILLLESTFEDILCCLLSSPFGVKVEFFSQRKCGAAKTKKYLNNNPLLSTSTKIMQGHCWGKREDSHDCTGFQLICFSFLDVSLESTLVLRNCHQHFRVLVAVFKGLLGCFLNILHFQLNLSVSCSHWTLLVVHLLIMHGPSYSLSFLLCLQLLQCKHLFLLLIISVICSVSHFALHRPHRCVSPPPPQGLCF